MLGMVFLVVLGATSGVSAGTEPRTIETPIAVPARSADTVGEQILLWPNGAPGALGDAPVDKPSITVFRPADSGRTTTAVIVIPGGAYFFLADGIEGTEVAKWLVTQGITAFVLRYRVGPRYRHPIELRDAQRAIRMVRSRALEFGVDAEKIGVMGFSAGGHLAATAGTLYDKGDPKASDSTDRVSSRPDFLILGYPVISFQSYIAGSKPLDAYARSGRNLLGDSPDPKLVRQLSAELQVTAQTPPTFLYHGTADRLVSVENSVFFYLALRRAGVKAELHTFADADHGGGLNLKHPTLGVWPNMLKRWLIERGFLPAPAPDTVPGVDTTSGGSGR